MRTKALVGACLVASLGLAGGAALAQSAPAAYLTAYRYLDGGVLAGQISPAASGQSNFQATRNTYDIFGRLLMVEGGVLASWQDETIAPANWSGFTVFKTVTYSYDGEGHVAQETYSGAADISGNNPVLAVTNVIQYAYDAYGRKVCSTVRMNAAVFGSIQPDACTLGAQGDKGPDRITKTVYDSLNRVIQIRKAVGTSLEQAYATYSYTLDSKQEYVIDANGNKTQLTYDGHDRQVGLYFPSPTQPSAYNPSTQATALSSSGAVSSTDYEAYSYDANGNRTSLRKRDGQIIAYQFNGLNRMTVKDLPGGTDNDVYYDYDNRGLVLDAKFASLGGIGLSYGYDFAGRKVIETSYGQTISYEYDSDGNRTKITWPNDPNGYYVSYSFDGLNRMSAAAENGSVPLASYEYDKLGRLALLHYGASGSGAAVGYTWSAGDDLLTLAHSLTGTGNSVSFTDTYSPAHQIVSAHIDNAVFQYLPTQSGTTSYVPNGLNQYAVITLPGQSATPIGYDPNGNLTEEDKPNGDTLTYQYDPENRLVKAIKNSVSVARYFYDPSGRRREKIVDSGTYAGTTQFLSAGDDEIAEYNQGGALIRRFIPGPSVDRPIAMVTAAGVKTYFHQDKTGSVIAMSNADGAIATIDNTPNGPADGPYTYDPYGNCVSNGQPCASGVPYKYTGRRYDPETGFYYYRARYYSPAMGRFLQTDPIGYTDDYNLYAYVANDPTNRTDPKGLFACGNNGKKGTSTDTSCSSTQNALKWLKSHRSQFSRADQRKIDAVVKAYGTLGDGNNVTVMERIGMGGGFTDDRNVNNIVAYVSIGERGGSARANDTVTLGTVVGEGVHVRDAQAGLTTGRNWHNARGDYGSELRSETLKARVEARYNNAPERSEYDTRNAAFGSFQAYHNASELSRDDQWAPIVWPSPPY